MAGPFDTTNEYLALIPIDKKLDPAWVASLFDRGEKTTYKDPAALEHLRQPREQQDQPDSDDDDELAEHGAPPISSIVARDRPARKHIFE